MTFSTCRRQTESLWNPSLLSALLFLSPSILPPPPPSGFTSSAARVFRQTLNASGGRGGREEESLGVPTVAAGHIPAHKAGIADPVSRLKIAVVGLGEGVRRVRRGREAFNCHWGPPSSPDFTPLLKTTEKSLISFNWRFVFPPKSSKVHRNGQTDKLLKQKLHKSCYFLHFQEQKRY